MWKGPAGARPGESSLVHPLVVDHPHLLPDGVFDGSLVHRKNESVLPALVTRECVQSEVLLLSNSVEPARPSRATSYVPVLGTTIVMLKEDRANLKKTSPVDASTPTV